MKCYQTIAALGCALLAVNATDAKTITVDNKVGSVAMYTSVQTACNAADPGDTILIAGSPTSYGDVTLSKQMHLVGPGYFLNENTIPGITKDAVSLSTVRYTLIELSSSTNSTVRGVQISALIVFAGVNNISCNQCYFTGGVGSSSFNGVISINQSHMSYCHLLTSGSSIRNSVVVGSFAMFNGTTATNCVVTSPGSFSSVAGSSISSSIFVTPGILTSGTFAGNAKGSVTQSLAVGGVGIGGGPTFLPSGAGNISTIAFTVEAFVQGQTLDKAYVLASGSPAIGTGLNGVDMGIFGGTLPYVISGVPSVPRITRFQVPSTATSASGLHIEMDAQSF